MPIGDPCGGRFEYGDEGIPSGLAFIEIPVADKARALRFYRDVLRAEVRDDMTVTIGTLTIMFSERDGHKGRDIGIFLKVDDPFGFNRRMTDDGIKMIRHPGRGLFGVYASFEDSEGNVIHVI